MTLNEAVTYFTEEAELRKRMSQLDGSFVNETRNEQEKRIHAEAAKNNRQLAEWLTELKEAKRLLKLAVEDFAKLDRENTTNKNCMMPEMDCANCPLSWDSVDDRIEPCHSWRYTIEALKLIWR